ncbi:MAG TPA: HD domain-containing protein [Anaerolineae bacterium]|nr:HD domain-containing protein [Anaerolineae bacterium]
MSAFVRLQHLVEMPQLQQFTFWELFGKPQSKTKAHFPDFSLATQYARRRLTELSPQLTYHSLWHTWNDVLPSVERLMALEQVSGTDALLLRTAAIYHDIGFVVQAANHEALSAQIAADVLPRFGYAPGQVERIRGMILATRLPQSPESLLEQILADADLDVLGRDDFWPRNQALRAECEMAGKTTTDAEWCACQLKFMQSHHYFTPSAQALRDAQKQQNITLLRQHLTMCGVC